MRSLVVFCGLAISGVFFANCSKGEPKDAEFRHSIEQIRGKNLRHEYRGRVGWTLICGVTQKEFESFCSTLGLNSLTYKISSKKIKVLKSSGTSVAEIECYIDNGIGVDWKGATKLLKAEGISLERFECAYDIDGGLIYISIYW